MMSMVSRWGAAAVMAGAILLSGPRAANAVPQLSYEVSCTPSCGGPYTGGPNPSSIGPGVFFGGSPAGFPAGYFVTLTASGSPSFPGGALPGLLSSVFAQSLVGSSAGTTLTVKITETGLNLAPGTVPTGKIVGDNGVSFVGTTGGTYSLKAYVDGTNTPYGQGTLLYSRTTNSSYVNDVDLDVVAGLTGDFSFTQVFTFQFNGTGLSIVANASLQQVVPEPATLATLGIGLLGLGLARIRRRRASA